MHITFWNKLSYLFRMKKGHSLAHEANFKAMTFNQARQGKPVLV